MTSSNMLALETEPRDGPFLVQRAEKAHLGRYRPSGGLDPKLFTAWQVMGSTLCGKGKEPPVLGARSGLLNVLDGNTFFHSFPYYL